MDSWSKSENVYHYIPLVTVLSNPDVRYFPVNKSESRSWNHSNKNSPILPRNLIFSLSFLFFFIFIVESISRWIDFRISLWDPSKKIIEILSNKNDSILLDFLFDFLLFGIRVNVIYIYIFLSVKGVEHYTRKPNFRLVRYRRPRLLREQRRAKNEKQAYERLFCNKLNSRENWFIIRANVAGCNAVCWQNRMRNHRVWWVLAASREFIISSHRALNFAPPPPPPL